LNQLNEDLDMKCMKAVLFFNDGWSLSMSMSKAGFLNRWRGQPEVFDHPLIKTIRAMSIDKRKKKRTIHKYNRLPFLGSEC